MISATEEKISQQFIRLVQISGEMIFAATLLVAGFAFGKERPGATKKNPGELAVVDHVDLQKYLGKWYEIASIPAWFQKDCAGGVTADYTLNPNGAVNVLNQCVTASKKVKKAKGRAWIVDKNTNAKLKVTFLPLGIRLFAGDYWIIDLGPGYEYAVVGHPSREYGWILARKPELDAETLKAIAARLEAKGYDFKRFKMTNQKDYTRQ